MNKKYTISEIPEQIAFEEFAETSRSAIVSAGLAPKKHYIDIEHFARRYSDVYDSTLYRYTKSHWHSGQSSMDTNDIYADYYSNADGASVYFACTVANSDTLCNVVEFSTKNAKSIGPLRRHVTKLKQLAAAANGAIDKVHTAYLETYEGINEALTNTVEHAMELIDDTITGHSSYGYECIHSITSSREITRVYYCQYTRKAGRITYLNSSFTHAVQCIAPATFEIFFEDADLVDKCKQMADSVMVKLEAHKQAVTNYEADKIMGILAHA